MGEMLVEIMRPQAGLPLNELGDSRPIPERGAGLFLSIPLPGWDILLE